MLVLFFTEFPIQFSAIIKYNLNIILVPNAIPISLSQYYNVG